MPLLIEERYIPLACLLPLRHYTTPLETAVKVNTWRSSAKEKKYPSGMIRFMICDMIRDPVRDPVRDRIRDPVRDAIRNPIRSDPSFVWIPVSNCSSLNKKDISLGSTQHAKKARELYTDKAIIHVQKKKNVKGKSSSTGTRRNTYSSQNICTGQASSGSFPYNNHVTEQFYQLSSELKRSENVEARPP